MFFFDHISTKEKNEFSNKSLRLDLFKCMFEISCFVLAARELRGYFLPFGIFSLPFIVPDSYSFIPMGKSYCQALALKRTYPRAMQ